MTSLAYELVYSLHLVCTRCLKMHISLIRLRFLKFESRHHQFILYLCFSAWSSKEKRHGVIKRESVDVSLSFALSRKDRETSSADSNNTCRRDMDKTIGDHIAKVYCLMYSIILTRPMKWDSSSLLRYEKSTSCLWIKNPNQT